MIALRVLSIPGKQSSETYRFKIMEFSKSVISINLGKDKYFSINLK